MDTASVDLLRKLAIHFVAYGVYSVDTVETTRLSLPLRSSTKSQSVDSFCSFFACSQLAMCIYLSLYNRRLFPACKVSMFFSVLLSAVCVVAGDQPR